MEFGIIVNTAIIILTGLIVGRLVTYVHLPNVTGFLLGGLLIGPSVLKFISLEAIESMSAVSDVALAFIAFSIGLSFKISYFKRVGLTPVVIALFEATLAVLFVQAGLVLAGFELPLAIVLGAIAAATAPAATVLVIKQYKASGPVTDTLLSVVALDDAVAIILFGFATTIAQMLMNTGGQTNILVSILTPFWEIALALGVGLLTGVAMKFALDFFTTRGNRLAVLIAFVFATAGIAGLLGVSELLASMAAGAALTNLSRESEVMSELSDEITPPIFMMFFVLSGAELNLSVIPTIGLIGVLYIVLRVVGKLLGAYTGGKLMKAPKEVSNYLGFMLIPQAGVAIGLTAIAERLVPAHGAEIKAVVLVGTLVYEFIGPIATKIALQKAGEITPEKN